MPTHDRVAAKRSRRQYGSGGRVYPYKTPSATGWRFPLERSDGSLTSKRGFTSRKAAQDARRRSLAVESTAQPADREHARAKAVGGDPAGADAREEVLALRAA